MPEKRTTRKTIKYINNSKKPDSGKCNKSGSKPSKKTLKQTAGATADICSKDINQLLMGNPPVSIDGEDIKAIWNDTKRTAKDLDKYGKSGWGNYPGMPPSPNCVIL
jgi:hypothetical protein